MFDNIFASLKMKLKMVACCHGNREKPSKSQQKLVHTGQNILSRRYYFELFFSVLVLNI